MRNIGAVYHELKRGCKMGTIYTIGFTKKSAKEFFELLELNGIDFVLDVRLNNTSQLAGFSKYPDLEYFLKTICNIEYKNDIYFAPAESTLKKYKKKEISWSEYVEEFQQLMQKRGIDKYIVENYSLFREKKVCLLCSEEKADYCHRRLVAEMVQKMYGVKIVHL